MEKFKNLLELTKYFSDEETCRNYLAWIRWEGKPVCPYCGYDKVYSIENGKRFKCANRNCYSKFSVTVGTIFEDTKIPLQKWFIGIYLACNHKKGISSLQLSRDLAITQKSAWFLLHRVREMLKDNAPGLLFDIVEVDETFVGGKDKNRHASKRKGYGANDKTIVFGAVQRHGKLVAHKMQNVNQNTLIYNVRRIVEQNAMVVSDNNKGYYGLKDTHYHAVVSHSTGEYCRGMYHTNTIEGFWSLFKRGIIGIYHNVSAKHINRYCDEFAYRYNYREFNQDEVVKYAMVQSEGKRLKYKELIAN
jgi:transposase-like protein